MTEKNCNLIFTGRLVEGMTLNQVHENLAKVYKTDIEKVKKVFSGEGAVIKKDVDEQMALKMQKTILNAGAHCEIKPIETVNTMEPDIHNAPMPTPERTVNPYAAPKSDVRPVHTDDDFFSGPYKRPASHGASWIFHALSLFLKRPFTWILSMVVYILIAIIVMIIPFLGAFIQNLLNPVYQAGFCIGAKNLDENDELSVGCVFQGFKNNFGQLILLGLLLLGTIIVIVAIAAITMKSAYGFDFSSFQSQMANPAQSISFVIYFTLFMMGLFIPIMMCYWFSPALIAINNKSVFEAIALSFKAALRNILPFIVFVLVFIGVTLLIGMAFGILVVLFARSGGIGVVIPILFYFFILFSIGPIMMLTMYTSYKDIFYKN